MSLLLDVSLGFQYTRMLADVADIVAGVDGLYGAFDRPIEQSTIFPVARVFPFLGEYQMARNGMVNSTHTIVVEVMTERNQAPEDIEDALPFAADVAKGLLADPTLGGSTQGMFNSFQSLPVRSSFGPLTYGGAWALGWRIEVDYYVEHNLKVTIPFSRNMDREPGYSYTDAIVELADICQTVDGLRDAFYDLPETPTAFPFGAVYPSGSEYGYEDSTAFRGLHNFLVELHIARSDLPIDTDSILPIGPNVAEKLWENPRLNEAADTIGTISYIYGFLGYSDISTIGWSIAVNGVKQRLTN